MKAILAKVFKDALCMHQHASGERNGILARDRAKQWKDLLIYKRHENELTDKISQTNQASSVSSDNRLHYTAITDTFL